MARLDQIFWILVLVFQCGLCVGLVALTQTRGFDSESQGLFGKNIANMVSAVENNQRTLMPEEQARLLRDSQYLFQTSIQFTQSIKRLLFGIAGAIIFCVILELVLLVRLFRYRNNRGRGEST